MSEIIINRSLIEEMVRHAREAYPNEACGILAGLARPGANPVVERVFRMLNADDSEVNYRLDPTEQLRVMKEIERSGLRMIAIYHSHPSSPAYPSQTDINRAFFPGTSDENFPGVFYVIVGLAGKEPEVNAYLITERGVEKVLVTTAS
jgi:proteasome lid subunit RPN8/RPN11